MRNIDDDLLTTEFIPTITGGIICGIAERNVLLLPPKISSQLNSTTNIQLNFRFRIWEIKAID